MKQAHHMVITAVVDPDDPTYINSPGWQVHSWCELQARIARIIAQADYHAIQATCTDTSCQECREDQDTFLTHHPATGEALLRPEDLVAYSLDRDDICPDHLMVDGWDEGFECTLPLRHAGPHRAASSVQGHHVGISDAGKHYTWAHEWAYTPPTSPAQAIKIHKEVTE